MVFWKRGKYEITDWILSILFFCPGSIGHKIRKTIIPLFMKSCGQNCVFGKYSQVNCIQVISMGNNSGFNDFAWIAGNEHSNGEIIIGNNVLIGPHVIMHSGNHNYNDNKSLIKDQGHTFSTITIEDNVWIAARVTILAGVTIRSGCIIAAGSVVTKSTIENGLYAGIPAKLIKVR